jgi:hypothetical protein
VGAVSSSVAVCVGCFFICCCVWSVSSSAAVFEWAVCSYAVVCGLFVHLLLCVCVWAVCSSAAVCVWAVSLSVAVCRLHFSFAVSKDCGKCIKCDTPTKSVTRKLCDIPTISVTRKLCDQPDQL